MIELGGGAGFEWDVESMDSERNGEGKGERGCDGVGWGQEGMLLFMLCSVIDAISNRSEMVMLIFLLVIED